MSALSLWAPRAVTPEGVVEGVRVVVRDGRIEEVGRADAAATGDEVFADATLLPGLVDLQVNGGAGAGYDDVSPKQRGRATRHHLERGTTSLLATIITAPLDDMMAALERLAGDVDPGGPVIGLHLEGPFLAEAKSGAHAREWLCDPTAGTVEGLIARAGGNLRMVTLAPELPGAEDAIERFARAGAVVAAGHSVATSEQICAAVERGLSFVTHLGNASDWPSRPFDEARQFRRSEPGLVGTFLFESRLRGSVILDGYHLDPRLAAALARLRGPDDLVLVSDATPAAGLAPGRCRFAGLEVEVRPEGYATAGGGLAGSVITLLDAVRVAVASAGLSLADAVRMAATTPARIIGTHERKGALRAGCDADLLLLGPDWRPRAVFHRGERVRSPSS